MNGWDQWKIDNEHLRQSLAAYLNEDPNFLWDDPDIIDAESRVVAPESGVSDHRGPIQRLALPAGECRSVRETDPAR